jgi:hypothetical protein
VSVLEPFCHSIILSIFSICLDVHLPVSLSINFIHFCVPVCLFISSTMCLFIYLSTHKSLCLSLRTLVHLSFNYFILYIPLSDFLFICMFIHSSIRYILHLACRMSSLFFHPSLCLFIHLSVFYLSFCLPVCLSFIYM